MNKFIKNLLILIVCIAVTGCDTGNSSMDSDSNVANTPLTGKIDGSQFKFSTGYITSTSDNTYSIYIWGESGSNITSVSDSNYSIYPYLGFSLDSIDMKQSYVVTTFGSSMNGSEGKTLTAWTNDFGGSLFDSGTLDVEPLDSDTLKLIFKNCTTTDGMNQLDGYCEVKLLP